jgi:hypothetical protein
MFKQYFGLKFNPFDKEIPTDKLFASRDMKELDSRLKYMLNARGISLVVGEPGSGKSTGLRKLVENLNHSLYKPCYLPLTTLTVKEEDFDKIFEPFYTTKPVGKGTGLGLSLSYDIIKKHKGDISVTSKLEVGTKFIVKLPVKQYKSSD